MALSFFIYLMGGGGGRGDLPVSDVQKVPIPNSKRGYIVNYDFIIPRFFFPP